MGRPRKTPLNGLAPGNVATEGKPVVTGAPVDLDDVPDEEERDETRAPELKDLPLFAGQVFGAGSSSSPSYISVTRLGPVPEGHLGQIDISANEQEIFRRWGGGEYRLDARTAQGSAVPRGMKTIRVAGEPNIQSEGFRAEYARSVRNAMGLPPEARPASAPAPAPPALVPIPTFAPAPAPPPPDNMMSTLLVALVQAQAAQQQTMISVLTAAAQQREESQVRMFELLSRAQETKAASDPLAMFREGLKLAMRIGGKGDEPGDPVSKFLDAAPGLLSGVKDIVTAEKGAPAAAAAKLSPAVALEQAFEVLGAREDVLFLEGELGQLGNLALKHLESLGAKKEDALILFFRQMQQLNVEHLREMGLVAPPVATPPAPEVPQAPPAVADPQPISAPAQA